MLAILVHILSSLKFFTIFNIDLSIILCMECFVPQILPIFNIDLSTILYMKCSIIFFCISSRNTNYMLRRWEEHLDIRYCNKRKYCTFVLLEPTYYSLDCSNDNIYTKQNKLFLFLPFPKWSYYFIKYIKIWLTFHI